MRILMVAPQPVLRSRGTPFSVLHRIRALLSLGHTVDLVTYPFGDTPQLAGLVIHRSARPPAVGDVPVGPSVAKLLLDVPLAVKAYQLARRGGFDLVHTHEEAGVLGPLIARKCGIPHLYDMHSSLPQQLGNFQRFNWRPVVALFRQLERYTLRGADGVIAICPELRDHVRSTGYQGPVAMIENTLDFDPLTVEQEEVTSLRARLGLEGAQVVLYTGTLEPYQGIELLVTAAAMVRREVPGARFLIVGGTSDRIAVLYQGARALGVEGSFVFVPAVPPLEVFRYHRVADVLVSPRATGTNTPLKVYQYLRAGKPIVATAIRSHTQVLSDATAELVPPTAEGLARGLVRVLTDAVRARGLAVAAGEHAQTAYSREAYVDALRDILSRITASHPPSTPRSAGDSIGEGEGLTAAVPRGRGRVLVVAPEPLFDDRGTPIAVLHVVQGLDHLGYGVDVLTYPLGRPPDIPGVRVLRSTNPFGIRHVPIGLSARKLLLDATLVTALASRLRATRYACVHAVEEAAFPAAVLGPRFGAKVIYDMQSCLPEQLQRTHAVFRLPGVPALLRHCERWALQRVDLVACSAGLARGVRAACPEARVHEWQFPAGTPAVSRDEVAAQRRAMAIPANARLVLYAGSFAPYQGLDLLLAALPVVRRRVPEALFVLVGAEPSSNGDLGAAVELERLGALRVIQRQPRDSMPALLAAADVLVSPRIHGQNAPLKIFEYLAAGRPIVATDIPAHRAVLAEDRAVLTAPEPHALASGITGLLEDSGRAERLGGAGRGYAEQHLGWAGFAQALGSLYEEALASRRLPSVR